MISVGIISFYKKMLNCDRGLSVSVESSPRSPQSVNPNPIQEPSYRLRSMAIILGRELTESERKIYRAMDAAMDAADAAAEESNSVSPRSPQPQSRHQLLSVARRLDFSSIALQEEEEEEEEEEVSPISHATLSVASWECAVAFPIWNDGTELELKKTESSVGECNVCYEALPARSNHVFTVCGHLFCVKCLLRWWDTSSSCPMCRAEILIPEILIPEITNNWVVADDDDDDDDDEESIPN